MITWRIVKWCGKTTNGMKQKKRKHLRVSRESSKDRWQTSHQLKVHWKNLQAGVADVTLRWIQENFWLFLLHLNSLFFHLFGYGRLSSPSSIQSLLHDLLAGRDVQMPIHHVFFQTNNRLVLLQLLAADTELELLYSDTFWSLDKEVGQNTHNIVSDSRGGDIFPVEKVHKESKYIGDHSLQKMIGCHVTFVSPPPSSLSQCSISSLTKSKIGCMQEEEREGKKKL